MLQPPCITEPGVMGGNGPFPPTGMPGAHAQPEIIEVLLRAICFLPSYVYALPDDCVPVTRHG